MRIHVAKLRPTSQWDQTILNLLWSNQLTPTGFDFTISEHGEPPANEETSSGDTMLNDLPDTDGVVLIIPGRYWHRYTADITRAIANYRWVLAVRTGDEENNFDITKIVHPNIRWWVQTPDIRTQYGDVRKFGVGFTTHFCDLPTHLPHLDYDLFLSAQNTHPRRYNAFAITNCMPGVNKVVHTTAGFTQGLAPQLYMNYMIHSKVALAPAGPDTPDTFRLYEALQSHCVPIADDVCANHDTTGYWESVLPDAPFPVLTEWGDAPGIVKQALADYPRNANRIAAWWMRQKRQYANWLHQDLNMLGYVFDPDPELITVVVPVSPIPSHPGIHILEETLNSIRHHLPDSEIILTFDGVRPEQEDMREAYEESIRCTLWRCDHYWKNVTPLIFEHHQHQSGMMQVALHRINTPLLMYVEQDTPLVIDEPIDWTTITDFITSERADLVRFHHEAHVLDVHRHLMQEQDGAFWRTTQWSQRPHVASKQFYLNAMQHLSADARCFLEEKFAGVAQEQTGWRLWIYHPDGAPGIKRSYHLDGRAGGPQFTDSQVF